MSRSTAAATSRYPGSDTDGIPASVTSSTRAPPSQLLDQLGRAGGLVALEVRHHPALGRDARAPGSAGAAAACPRRRRRRLRPVPRRAGAGRPRRRRWGYLRVRGFQSRSHPPRGGRDERDASNRYRPCTGLTQNGSLRWRGDQYRVLHGHPAGPGAARRSGRPGSSGCAASATRGSPEATPATSVTGWCRRTPSPARACGRRSASRTPSRSGWSLVGLGRSAAGDAAGGHAAVLEPGQPQGGDIRRDVLRQGRVGARPPRVRGQLGQERQRPAPLVRRAPHDPDGRGVRGAPAGRQVRHRARRADVRVRPVRLAVHDGAARHAVACCCCAGSAAACSAPPSWAAWRAR